MSQPETLPRSFSIAKAHETQKSLCKLVVQKDGLPNKIRLIAGVDAAYFGNKAVGAVAVLDYESLETIESEIAWLSVKFPYIPTLLSFRELPVVLAAIGKLNSQPDVFLVDAHGTAHPYGCGFASHLGLVIGKPTIGVAKNKLVGESKNIGGKQYLVHEGNTVAAVLTTQEDAKPVYVSVGHLISLRTAIRITKHCIRENRIPAPLVAAHRLASDKRCEALSTSNRNSERIT